MSVVVIGAGLSGLRAAHELHRVGIDVTVLEAGDRVGGKTETARAPFLHGQHADLGGSFIDLGQHEILGLCRELGLELTPGFSLHPPAEPGSAAPLAMLRNNLVHDGRRLDPAEQRRLLERLEAALAATPPVGMETLRAWSRRVGLSARDEGMLGALAGINPIDLPGRTPALYWTGWPIGAVCWKLADGADRLAHALAAPLDVRLGQPVRRVAVERGRVVIEAEGETLTARHVIVAVTIPALGQIAFNPVLPAWKSEAILSTSLAQGGKACAQYADAETLAKEIGPGIVADGPVSFVWPGPVGEADTMVAIGAVADRADGLLSRPEQALEALDDVIAAVVGRRPQRLAGVVKDWSAEERFGGMVSMLMGPRGAEVRARLAAPLPRLLFAGEYTADVWPSAMEGALRSGARAARTVALEQLRPLAASASAARSAAAS